MTICYPLATQIDHTELKFSLRSIQKFLSPPFEVVIIGTQLPGWLTNVTVIEMGDIPGRPMLSVRKKILASLNYADEIFFMNDDIFLLRKYNTKVYYSSGSLKGKAESGARPLCEQLEKLNKPLSYYGHYPAVYKKDFVRVMEHFTDDCITKSAYLNYLEVESKEVPDCKILKPMKPDVIREWIKYRPCFSTGIQSLPSALTILQELFPEPSKYES